MPVPYGQQERAPVIFLHGLRAELVLCGDEERVDDEVVEMPFEDTRFYAPAAGMSF